MKLAILVVGRSAPSWVTAASETYARRLRGRGGVERIEIKPERFNGDIGAVRAAESLRVRRTLRPSDRLIVFDERGKSLDSRSFADLVDQCRLDGVGRLVLAVGGAYGHDAEVRGAAWRVVSLSAMVMAHDVAQVVLYEQLYRAFSILDGAPYHHD